MSTDSPSQTRVSVIGGGTMGNGIAHVFALGGFPVTLVETAPERLEKATGVISGNLAHMVAKERITQEQADRALAGIEGALDVAEGVSQADLVIEAVPENPDIKRQVLGMADQAAPEAAVLASNTSSISITRLASMTGRADRFIGMHFFNPVPVMKLVEVVSGLETSSETAGKVTAWSRAVGKTPVAVADSPGFVSNRVLMPMINEAIFCVHEGVGGPEQVDEVMKLGMAHPMGPLRLADFIGLDVCLDILNVLYEGFKDPKYRPCPLLVKMVEAGRLGDKSGRGFYSHGS